MSSSSLDEFLERNDLSKRLVYNNIKNDNIYFSGLLYKFDKVNNELTSDILDINNKDLCCDYQVKKCLSSPEVVKIGQGKTGDIFLIDNKYVIKKVDLKNPPYLKLDKDKDSDIIVKRISDSCGFPNLSDYQFIKSDKYTNEFMIGFLISKYMEKSNLDYNPFIDYYGAYICGISQKQQSVNFKNNVSGNMLLEYANFGDLQKFKDTEESNDLNYIDDILTQIVFGLDYLKSNYYFSHGDLKPANVLLTKTSVNMTYSGINLQTDIAVKIADFDKSSITLYKSRDNNTNNIQSTRIFNENKLANLSLKIKDFEQDIKVKNGVSYYQFDNYINVNKNTYIRHMGIPFYMSYDLYTIIVGVLMIEKFYYQITETPELKKVFWDTLWVDQDDEQKLQEKILKYHNSDNIYVSYIRIIDFLDNIKLKCDLFKDIISAMK